ncbi:hypothetical protein O181_035726 [Austropuccinia psidii MF-1]|uniref:Uncharacterized protein n=1 Tax=Austropuccinia psidii MF-1 TaxID=1389203 RepID=A0A9Q3D8T8_9BASI|nr:hypothetical protein [Austropuccinia psidii MF-1]
MKAQVLLRRSVFFCSIAAVGNSLAGLEPRPFSGSRRNLVGGPILANCKRPRTQKVSGLVPHSQITPPASRPPVYYDFMSELRSRESSESQFAMPSGRNADSGLSFQKNFSSLKCACINASLVTTGLLYHKAREDPTHKQLPVHHNRHQLNEYSCH